MSDSDDERALVWGMHPGQEVREVMSSSESEDAHRAAGFAQGHEERDVMSSSESDGEGAAHVAVSGRVLGQGRWEMGLGGLEMDGGNGEDRIVMSDTDED